MRNKMQIVVAVIFLGSVLSSAAVAMESLQSLLTECYATDKPDGSPYCVGRVTGVFRMMLFNGLALRHGEGTKLLSACVSDAYPSTEDQLKVFLNWANKHPENWSNKNPEYSELSDVEGIIRAMREAWPCR